MRSILKSYFDFVRRIICSLYQHEWIIRMHIILIYGFFVHVYYPRSHLKYKPKDNHKHYLYIPRSIVLKKYQNKT